MEIDPNQLSYVKSSNGLRKKEKFSKIKRTIVYELNKTLSCGSFKTNENVDHDLIRKIMQCIEELVKKKHGINKLELLLDVCRELFGSLSTNELENIKRQVEYNVDNNLVEKLPSYMWIGNKVIKVLKKKFLD